MRLGVQSPFTYSWLLWGRCLVICLATIATPVLCYDAVAEETSALGFLRIQPDIRARGMGEAAVGMTEMASPYASNPSVFAVKQTPSLYLGGGAWWPEFNLDLDYYCFGLSGPITDFAGAALSLRAFSYGDIIRTNEYGYINRYHSFDLAASGSFAIALDPNLAVGTTLSLLYSKLSEPYPEQNFGSGSATSLAYDFGILFHDIFPQTTARSRRSRVRPMHAQGFAIGLALQNLGPDIDHTGPTLSGPIPHNLALGISCRPADFDQFGATLALEVDGSLVDDGTVFSDKLAFGMGAEITLFSHAAARVGHYMDPTIWHGVTTLGFSLGSDLIRFNLSRIPATDSPLSKTTFLALSVRPTSFLPHSGRCGP